MRLLVFNFFAGIKDRGIPHYARELQVGLRRAGVETLELACPAALRRLPAPLLNLLFVAFEQVVAPWLRWRWQCAVTVYPYNSGGMVDALLGRSVIVLHDLIPNGRDQRGLAARYIRACQAVHCHWKRPLAAVSRHTQRLAQRVQPFAACPLYLWPNPFFAFEQALAGATPAAPREADRPTTVLVCSGLGPNKDFGGLLHLLREYPGAGQLHWRVLGFGDDAPLARRRVVHLPAGLGDRVCVLPRLSLAEVLNEMQACDLVWVHSLNEGFGRPVVEARMCGKPVVASDIGAFRQQRHLGHVHLYREGGFAHAFALAVHDGLATPPAPRASAQRLHAQLQRELERFLSQQAGASAG